MKFQPLLFAASMMLSLAGDATAQDIVLQDGLPQGSLVQPIEVRDQHPLALLHTTFRPSDASIIKPSAYRLTLEESWSNTLNYKEDAYHIDAETRVTDIAFRYGLSPGFELQLNQNIVWRGSGESDQIIDEFHKTFGIKEGPGSRIPKDQFVIEGFNEDGTSFQLTRDGFGLSGLELGVKYSPSDPNDNNRWALLLNAGLPTGTSEYGQESVDLQLALYGQTALHGISLYSGGAILYFQDNEINNLHLLKLQYAGFLGAGYQTSESTAIYAGLHVSSILTDRLPDFPDYQSYIDLGVRRRVSNSIIIDISGRENVLHSQGTTDITLSLGLTYQSD